MEFQQRLAEIQIQSDKKIEILTQVINKNIQSCDGEDSFTENAVWSAIETFEYQPNEDISFEAYFRRYEDIYANDCKNWSDSKKVRLLTRKLDTAKHTRFINYILLRITNEPTFQEAVKLLTDLFSPKTSLFHKRWKCLNLVREENEDFTVFVAKVNKGCNDFKLIELSADSFKCHVFCQGLISPKEAEVRRRVLNKLESEPNLTLQHLAEDCQRYVYIKKRLKRYRRVRDLAYPKGTLHEEEMQPPPKRSKPERTQSSPKKQNKLPLSPCVRCGALHWSTDCNYQKWKCFNCSQMGHKSSHCRKKAGSNYIKTTEWDKQNEDNIRKYVPVQILGRKVNLQLDSGSV